MDTPVKTQPQVDKRVLIDLDRCIECRSCAAACYYSHANIPAVGFARSGWALLPVVCRQCKAAACVDACPAEAMVRDESGVVKRKAFQCIGCGSCVRACPFGVISAQLGGVPGGFRSPDRLSGHHVGKCDLCADRTERPGNGEGGSVVRDAVPRCVAACPAGALVWADEHHPAEGDLDVLGGRTTGEDPYKRR